MKADFEKFVEEYNLELIAIYKNDLYKAIFFHNNSMYIDNCMFFGGWVLLIYKNIVIDNCTQSEYFYKNFKRDNTYYLNKINWIDLQQDELYQLVK